MNKNLEGLLITTNAANLDKSMAHTVLFIGTIHIYLLVTSKTTKENPSQNHLQLKNQIRSVKTGWSCLVLMNSVKVSKTTDRL